MALQTLTQTQQSLSATLPGTWKLAGGRAITLQPRESGFLGVAHGQLWATYDGPHAGPLNDLGDHVVGAGGQLRLEAGQRVVVEAFNAASPAYFSWDPLPARVRTAASHYARLMQPLSDLQLALAMGSDAVARLVAGLAALGWDLVAGRERERLADCAIGAKDRTCGAHGTMS